LAHSSGQEPGFTNQSYLEDSWCSFDRPESWILIWPSNLSLWKEKVGAKIDAVDKAAFFPVHNQPQLKAQVLLEGGGLPFCCEIDISSCPARDWLSLGLPLSAWETLKEPSGKFPSQVYREEGKRAWQGQA
jgi:hypothetical protein